MTWIYNNPSYLLRSSDYEVIEMIKSHQSLWKVYHISLNRDAASLTYSYSILTTPQIALFCKVLCFFPFLQTQSWRFLHESTHVKWIPPTEWTCVVQLVKRSNVNDGVGNVNYSGIFTLLTTSLRAKGHIDLILIASKPEGIPMMHYIN